MSDDRRPEQNEAPESVAADGWIAWAGGECPVTFGQIAQTKLRDGRIMDPQPGFVWAAGRGGCNPGNLWSHSLRRNDPEDIIAYFVVSK